MLNDLNLHLDENNNKNFIQKRLPLENKKPFICYYMKLYLFLGKNIFQIELQNGKYENTSLIVPFFPQMLLLLQTAKENAF